VFIGLKTKAISPRGDATAILVHEGLSLQRRQAWRGHLPLHLALLGRVRLCYMSRLRNSGRLLRNKRARRLRYMVPVLDLRPLDGRGLLLSGSILGRL
jgi:hypothetical protein